MCNALDKPTPDDVRELLRKHGLTGSQAGRICGVDSRTVRRWTAPRGSSGSREIPIAAWRLLCVVTGECEVSALFQLQTKERLQ